MLVAITGATFAYFSTEMQGNNAILNTTAARLGSVNFVSQSVNATSVLPGWSSGAKTVTVHSEPTDYSINYSCYLNITTNTFVEGHIKLQTSGTGANSDYATAQTVTTGNILIASGTFAASNTAQINTMTYTLSFPEIGSSQNTSKEDSIVASVTCQLDGSVVYYNSNNPNGTTSISAPAPVETIVYSYGGAGGYDAKKNQVLNPNEFKFTI